MTNRIGEHVHEMAERAVVVVKDAGESAWFEINGVRLVVAGQGTADAVTSRCRKEYRKQGKGAQDE